jgi:type IV pilus assembly protein PilF
MKSLRTLGAGLACVLWLYGCAAPGAGTGAATTGATGEGKEWVTASDEPEVRKRARLRLELAAGYFEQGQLTVALDEVKQALAVDPAYAPAYNLRGLIYMRLDEPRLAESSFQQALRLAPRDPDTWHNLGWLQCQDKRYPDALRSFTTALQAPVYPGAARSWMAQGICQARAGLAADAERSLARSFELDASNPITTYNLADLLLQRGELTRAQFYIRRLNNSELANAESLWLGARIEHRLNNREGARQLGEQLRRRFPESKEVSAYERGAFNE